MLYDTCYTSSACNRVPSAAHWGKNNLICYGSCNTIYIYDPHWGSGGKIIKNLFGHSKRVNSVRWISGIGDYEETELVSGSSDGTAIVWSYKEGNYVPFILKGHEDTVNRVDGFYKLGYLKYTVIVTASLDCTVKIWTRITNNDEFVQSQNINLGHHVSVGLKITFYPSVQKLLLACGLDNSKVHLYVENTDQDDKACKFDPLQILGGAEDWVECLDFKLNESGDLFLAASSLDSFIRLWKISPAKGESDASDTVLKYSIIRKDIKVKIDDTIHTISPENPLGGHVERVYSVNWNPKKFTLLSSSQDKSMIIWEYDTESEVWLESIRVGEVGGNTLGFYGGMFGPNGTSIMAYGYLGSFHIWNLSKDTDIWQPATIVGGHFEEVVDLSWEPKGEFLISVSADETTRIHAPWSIDDKKITWHEIARPQVHGYSMSSIALLSRYQFASSAEEKVIRIFNAPTNFIENFKNICKISDDEMQNGVDAGPKGAAVPSLGLSNKAVYENHNTERAIAKSNKEPYPEESYFTAVNLTEPPTEETLLQNTLWPEIQKLYGHGYEVYSLAASPDAALLASACKSTTSEHAAILIWDTSRWKITQKLISHNLTVVQLSFSPDSKYLLSVSRDRRWTLFERDLNTNTFALIATTDKTTGIHTRIIWCCAWSHDSQYFATGSRDGKIVIWMRNPDKVPANVLGQCQAMPNYLDLKGESVTALAFAPVQVSKFYLLAVGLESGVILLYKWNISEWELHLKLQNNVAHHLTVRRLMFRPVLGEAGNKKVDDNILQLASCSADCAVKIYNIYLGNLK
ncbi:hypothetical protein ILUMI_09946 [Ignelater luminosus]|uniref:Elongator complex protein 2 n=1 Tax=Ignelater luminosus TaxID=2038154 RepID=A0A8K0D842_IGNLU|nr:hypothetical protein ILUMI_09946 [Ignelater luminosus]